MYKQSAALIEAANRIIVLQAENPDGDSLGTSLALEEILGDLGKEVVLYCRIDTPKYLRYINGWDRVVSDFDPTCDLAIIVDAASEALFMKTLGEPGLRHYLETHPVLVIDHHQGEVDYSFSHTLLAETLTSTSEVVYRLASDMGWSINPQAAEDMLIAIMSDSLGLTTQNVTADSFHVAGALTELGASNSVIEARRREYLKKSPEILTYKGELIGRIEYALEGRLALVHIPWEDIQAYSDQYNPSVLVLDEMRLVEGVEIAVAIKTYPDGKVTGKIRSNAPIANIVAGYFGAGGHQYSAGFKVFEDYQTVITELVQATGKALREQDHAA